MKFGAQQQIWNFVTVMWPKNENLKNSSWRTAAVLKISFGHNSGDCPSEILRED